VAEQSKFWVCRRCPAGIAGSNPSGSMDVFLLYMLCVIGSRPVRRADHSSRGVLPTVVRRFEWPRNLKNVESMARVGPQCHRKTKIESRERYPLCRDFRNDHITYNHYSKFRPTRMGYLRKIWEIYLWVNIFCSEIKILREQIESRFSCSND